MARSKLLDGIETEDMEAVRGQVWAFDHATVLGEVNRRARRKSANAMPDALHHALNDGLIDTMGALEWRAAKLARVLSHLGIRFNDAPTTAELIDLCLDAEDKAVKLLLRIQGPGKTSKGQPPFQEHDVLQLAQYVTRRLFENVDAKFANKPQEEQDRIVETVLLELAKLPEDVRERVRHEAGLAELSTGALRRTGALAALGSALAGTVGIAGFAAYTTLTSTMAAVAGLFGATLPFLFYAKATTALAFVANPLLTGPLALIAGGALVRRANRQMKDRLVPVMVTTAILSGAEHDTRPNLSDIAACFGQAHANAGNSGRLTKAAIHATYPCLAR